MPWLFLALAAYFLNAIAMVVDKTLVQREIKNPFVYTFYIAALGGVLMVFLVPFVLEWPGYSQLGISLLSGAAFTAGLVSMYRGLRREDASRLLPMIGGLTPIAVFILAYYLLGENLTLKQIIAFTLIIAGAFLISVQFEHYGAWHWLKVKLKLEKRFALPQIRRALWLAVPAALFFGLSHTLAKDVYNHQPFWSGFVWTRLGALIMAILPMLWAKNRYDLRHQARDKNSANTRVRFLFGQACGGSSAILIQYVISLASVSLVQALQGTQYVFVFIAVLILTNFRPDLLKEKISTAIIMQKITAIILISAGIWFII